MLISDKILYLRKKLGLTQEELAEQLNVSRQSISKWESAHSVPDISKIMAMAKLFSVSTDYLLIDEIENIDGCKSYDFDTLSIVTIEISDMFMEAKKKQLKLISYGVQMIIFSPVMLVGLQSLVPEDGNNNIINAIGIVCLFVFVVLGIGLIVYSETIINKYKYIEEGKFELSNNVEGIIKESKNTYESIRTKNLIINVSMIILSVLPLVVSAIIVDNYTLHVIMTALLLCIVSFAVAGLVKSEGRWDTYKKLLSEDEYEKSNRERESRSEKISEVYWSIVIAIYLLWSFLTHDWHITWIVWPVAALLSTVIDLIVIKDKISK